MGSILLRSRERIIGGRTETASGGKKILIENEGRGGGKIRERRPLNHVPFQEPIDSSAIRRAIIAKHVLNYARRSPAAGFAREDAAG